MARKRTKAYPESFRRGAVRMADLPDRTAADVAKELGINEGQIHDWRTQFSKLSKIQFKVVDGVLCQGWRVKYGCIESLRTHFDIVMMCWLLGVSRSGYYPWRKQPQSARQQRKEHVSEVAEAIFYGFKQRYGAPRLTEELINPDAPNKKWVMNITYFQIKRDWLYKVEIIYAESYKTM